jgi:hypothetical protein
MSLSRQTAILKKLANYSHNAVHTRLANLSTVTNPVISRAFASQSSHVRFDTKLIPLSVFHKSTCFFSTVSNDKKQTNLNMVKLKNCSEVPESMVIVTMLSLETLISTNPIAFYELVQKCRNPKHKMFADTEEDIKGLGLMHSGSVHECIRNIVLSAVEGDDLDMRLTSPFEQSSFTKRK